MLHVSIQYFIILCNSWLGCGDFNVSTATLLPDPCPLPSKMAHCGLSDRDRHIYAPMAGLGSLVYNKVNFCNNILILIQYRMLCI